MNMKKEKLTQARLKELLNYNPETGVFTWRKSRGSARGGSIAGSKNSDGYIEIRIDSKLYYAHRLAWLYEVGVFPFGIKVDHISRVKDNNKFVNLRLVSDVCSARNVPVSSKNKSGVTGVYFSKERSKWIAQIKYNNKTRYLGSFKIFKDAVFKRWEAEKENNWADCQINSSSFLYLVKKGII